MISVFNPSCIGVHLGDQAPNTGQSPPNLLRRHSALASKPTTVRPPVVRPCSTSSGAGWKNFMSADHVAAAQTRTGSFSVRQQIESNGASLHCRHLVNGPMHLISHSFTFAPLKCGSTTPHKNIPTVLSAIGSIPGKPASNMPLTPGAVISSATCGNDCKTSHPT